LNNRMITITPTKMFSYKRNVAFYNKNFLTKLAEFVLTHQGIIKQKLL